MKSKLVILAALAFSSAVSANCTPQICSGVYIESLTITKAGSHYIATSGDEKKLNCTAESGVYATLAKTENSSQILASLLAAQMAGKKVDVRIAEGSVGCTIEYVNILRQ